MTPLVVIPQTVPMMQPPIVNANRPIYIVPQAVPIQVVSANTVYHYGQIQSPSTSPPSNESVSIDNMIRDLEKI